MSQQRLLITDYPWQELDIERAILEPLGVEIVAAADGDEARLRTQAQDVFAIATCWAKVTEKVIRAARNCKVICRMGIGLDNIDLTVASELGIPVTNVPDYCIEEVADHTLAIILALKRKIAFYHLRTKQGEYDLRAGAEMERLRGKRLGLVGFGRIGREVYSRAKTFGMDVVASTPSGNSYGTDCPMVTLEELFRTSKMISLHVPLNEQTHHLIDTAAISQMCDGVCLINTSRGSLIEPMALSRAIHAGLIAGAGLDVFEPEPPSLKDPLYQHENVIVTPHAAFVSQEALVDLRTRVAEQIKAVLEGRTPENIVN